MWSWPDVRHCCFHDCCQIRGPRLQAPFSLRSAQLIVVRRCPFWRHISEASSAYHPGDLCSDVQYCVSVNSLETTSSSAILVAVSAGGLGQMFGIVVSMIAVRSVVHVPLSSHSAQLEEVCRCLKFLAAQAVSAQMFSIFVSMAALSSVDHVCICHSHRVQRNCKRSVDAHNFWRLNCSIRRSSLRCLALMFP